MNRKLKTFMKLSCCALALLSSASSNVSYASDLIELDSNKFEENTKANYHTSVLKGMTDSFLSFCKDRLEEYEKNVAVFDKNNPQLILKEKNNHKKSIQKAKYLKTIVEDYLNKNRSADDVLEEILNARFAYLKNRKTKIDRGDSIPPTDPSFIKQYQSKNDRKSKYFLGLAESSILKYQMFNEIIFHVFRSASVDDFSPQTKELMRASVTLHPILLGRTDDLSHPNAAISIYSEHYGTPKSLQGKLDLDYYDGCIKIEQMERWRASNWCRTLQQAPRNKYYYTQKSGGKKTRLCNLDLPDLTWLDDNQALQNIINPKPIIKLKPQRKIKKKKIIKNKNTKIRSQLKTKQTQKIDKENEINLLKQDSDSLQPTLKIEKTLDQPENTNSNSNNVEIIELNESQKLKETEQKSVDIGAPKKLDKAKVVQKATNFKDSYVPARGNRLFHSSSTSSTSSSSSLNNNKVQNRYHTLGNHQSTVDAIFSKQFSKVTFRNFKALWEFLNGDQSVSYSKSGSSHIKLLDSDGNYAGSTFAHGKGFEYGRKSIKYLRDALVTINVSPDF